MQATPTKFSPVSPLVLADRLITLAQDADRAGYSRSATRLLGLAYAVFDEDPRPARRATPVKLAPIARPMMRGGMQAGA